MRLADLAVESEARPRSRVGSGAPTTWTGNERAWLHVPVNPRAGARPVRPKALGHPAAPGGHETRDAGCQRVAAFDALGRWARVLAFEALDPTGGVHHFLLAREERVASRANIDRERTAGRTGVVDRTASAGNRRNFVLWVDARFHISISAFRGTRRTLPQPLT